MKKNTDSIYWGVLLILAALAVLVQKLGYIDFSRVSMTFWTWVFVGVAVVFFLRYLFSKLKGWGFLFPATIFSALAYIVTYANRGVKGEFLGSLIFIAVAIPFVVAFLTNIKANWWALIPAFACSVLAFIVNYANAIRGEWIGALVMFSIGLPFLLVYLVNRSQRWALIPGGILVAIGLMSLASMASQWVAVLIPFIIALAFIVVYLIQPGQWWALIPGGIIFFSAVSGLLDQVSFGSFPKADLPAVIMFLGWAGTFYYLWLKRGQFPTAWARVPAMIFVIVSVVLLVVGYSQSEIGLIVLLFAGGIILLVMGLRPRKALP